LASGAVNVDQLNHRHRETAENVIRHFEAGLWMHQSGRIGDAEIEYRQVIAAMPDHADAHHLVGIIALERGLYIDAARSIAIAVNIRPNSAQYANSLGMAEMACGNVTAAMAAFTKAIHLRPDYPEAHRGLGTALDLQGRHAEAASSFCRALRCRPGYAEVRRHLKAVLSKLDWSTAKQAILDAKDVPVRGVARGWGRTIGVLTTRQEPWSRPARQEFVSGERAGGSARTNATGNTSSAGFTLLETLVVLVVLSLLAGLVLARGPSRSPSVETEAAADSLAQVLRSARVAAISTGEPTRVEVDLTNRNIRSGRGAPVLLPSSVRLAFTTVSGRTGASGRASIGFAADGSSSGGVFALSIQTVQSLLTVDVFTGRVEVGLGG
jgi:prepilin-type N-terminal cleavage/methylation domain-containing protein